LIHIKTDKIAVITAASGGIPFDVIPAIDIENGSCVRLFQGEIGTETTYYENPVDAFRHWMSLGAKIVHVVDLDAATGKGDNRAVIKAVVAAAGRQVKVQVGGGIRTPEIAGAYAALGVWRLVIGTAAVKKPALVKQLSAKYGPERIVVALDQRNETVQVKGWTEDSGQGIYDMGRLMEENGAGTILLSSIEADGAFTGPDLKATGKMVQAVGIPVLAAGGTRNLEDIQQLREIGASGVVIGKALYEGRIDLASALHFNVV
jgi:phosphoribosylformimino-5-aminoimidazole carboxamide ribotide isomerase